MQGGGGNDELMNEEKNNFCAKRIFVLRLFFALRCYLCRRRGKFPLGGGHVDAGLMGNGE